MITPSVFYATVALITTSCVSRVATSTSLNYGHQFGNIPPLDCRGTTCLDMNCWMVNLKNRLCIQSSRHTWGHGWWGVNIYTPLTSSFYPCSVSYFTIFPPFCLWVISQISSESKSSFPHSPLPFWIFPKRESPQLFSSIVVRVWCVVVIQPMYILCMWWWTTRMMSGVSHRSLALLVHLGSWRVSQALPRLYNSLSNRSFDTNCHEPPLDSTRCAERATLARPRS